MRALLALALLLAAGAPAATGQAAEGPTVAVSPDPLAPDEPFTVRLTGVDASTVANASAKICLARDGAAQFCLLPVRMREENGALVAESPQGFGAGQQVGVNVTLYHPDGARSYVPAGIADEDRAYVFFTVAGAPEREVPALPAAAALAALLLAALAARRRSG